MGFSLPHAKRPLGFLRSSARRQPQHRTGSGSGGRQIRARHWPLSMGFTLLLPASSLQERPARNCVLQVRQFSALHIQDLATLGEPMARERKTASHPAEPIPTGIANDRYIWSINGCHHQRKAMARPAFARCFQRWRWRCPVACGEAETDGATIRSGHRRRSPLEKVRRTRMSSGSWELPD